MSKFIKFTYIFENKEGNEVSLDASVRQDLIKAVVKVTDEYSRVALGEGLEGFTITNKEAEKIVYTLNETDEKLELDYQDWIDSRRERYGFVEI